MNVKNIGDNIIKYYFDYYSDKGEFRKVVYAVSFKKECAELFSYVSNGSFVHDMDLEREFEVLLCELTIAIYNWRKANGLFKRFKEQQSIKKIDTLMNKLFQKYFRLLYCIYK